MSKDATQTAGSPAFPMPSVVASPKKFVIGAELLAQMGDTARDFGDNLFVISDPFIIDRIENEALPEVEKSGLKISAEKFGGECTEEEIQRLVKLAGDRGANVIVGVGGGKTLDTAKAVAFYAKKPVLIYPTIASSDAPCTSLAVIYKKDGSFSRYLFLPQSPDAVLADTGILAGAPARFFSAGIGDALATWFEARAVWRSHGLNLLNRHATRTGLGMARICFDLLAENTAAAMAGIDGKVATPAVQQIVEATIYLSGIGAESGGLAAAHAVHNGMCVVEELHHAQHGEKVVFGLLVQLVLENAPQEEIEEVARIARMARLPLTLEALGVKTFEPKVWREVARLACAPEDTMDNMPSKPGPDEVYAAIVAAKNLGERLAKA